jgi:hypothetical protein
MPGVQFRRRASVSGARPVVSRLDTDHPLAFNLVYAMLDPATQYDHVKNAAPTTRYMSSRGAAQSVGECGVFNGLTTNTCVTTFVGGSTERTWALWLRRVGAGGSGFGRVLSCNVTSSSNEGIVWNGTVSELSYTRGFSISNGGWSVPFTTGAMRLYVVSFDGSSASNDPLVHVDGVPVTPTERSTPSGTLMALTTAFQIGGLGGSSVGWDGLIGPVLCWDRILTDSEKWSLYDPLTRWDLWQQPSTRLWFDIAAAGIASKSRIYQQSVQRAAYH